jgi:hypothetical protein
VDGQIAVQSDRVHATTRTPSEADAGYESARRANSARCDDNRAAGPVRGGDNPVLAEMSAPVAHATLACARATSAVTVTRIGLVVFDQALSAGGDILVRRSRARGRRLGVASR